MAFKGTQRNGIQWMVERRQGNGLVTMPVGRVGMQGHNPHSLFECEMKCFLERQDRFRVVEKDLKSAGETSNWRRRLEQALYPRTADPLGRCVQRAADDAGDQIETGERIRQAPDDIRHNTHEILAARLFWCSRRRSLSLTSRSWRSSAKRVRATKVAGSLSLTGANT